MMREVEYAIILLALLASIALNAYVIYYIFTQDSVCPGL